MSAMEIFAPGEDRCAKLKAPSYLELIVSMYISIAILFNKGL
jgi:hypothetical protein